MFNLLVVVGLCAVFLHELDMLYEMELSNTLEKVRDVFIIGCRTGLRVSDYWRCVGDTVFSEKYFQKNAIF
ncbi:MAG: hypothetical protein LBD76_02355 [Prevotellaceae bacterium]|jgi:hypothetical protein|nr:hypothetical protein [Prevotellaceae bacterium]